MENPTTVPSKRFRVSDGQGNSCSVRISANTPAPALGVIFAGRFKGKNIVAVEVDDELVALDCLYDAVQEGKEYRAVFQDTTQSAQPTPQQFDAPASSQLPFQPLALFESCFPLKNGTPRQGILAPNSQGRIKIAPYRGTTPKDVLEGLEQYSHVWIVFWFHGNANKHMRAKVQPPRLNGISVGCLATRTPHRLIPIGMTAAKLIRIENDDTLIVSGIDLIDGTPILDVKPYVPRYDSIPEAICPDWMIQPTDITTVTFTDHALESLEKLAHTLKILPSAAVAKQTIEETLHSDPRSVYRKKKCEKEAFGFHVDTLNVQCFIEDNNRATVYNIEPGDQESDTQPEALGIQRSASSKQYESSSS